MWRTRNFFLISFLLSLLIFKTKSLSGLKLIEKQVHFMDVNGDDLVFVDEQGKVKIRKAPSFRQKELITVQCSEEIVWAKFGYDHLLVMRNKYGKLSFYKSKEGVYHFYQSIEIELKAVLKLHLKTPLLAIANTDTMLIELYNYVDNFLLSKVQMAEVISELNLCQNMVIGIGQMIHIWEYNNDRQMHLVWREIIQGAGWTLSEDCERMAGIQKKGRMKSVKLMDRKGMSFFHMGDYRFKKQHNIRKVNFDQKGQTMVISGQKQFHVFKFNEHSQRFQRIETFPLTRYTVQKVFKNYIYITKGKDLYSYKLSESQTKNIENSYKGRNLEESSIGTNNCAWLQPAERQWWKGTSGMSLLLAGIPILGQAMHRPLPCPQVVMWWRYPMIVSLYLRQHGIHEAG